MKHGFFSPLLWEYQYPKIEYSHNGAADTREHSTSVPKHVAGIAPCKTAAGKVPGMSYRGLAAQKV